jgi:hypothetical protein
LRGANLPVRDDGINFGNTNLTKLGIQVRGRPERGLK